MDYNQSFANRVNQYDYAITKYPDTLKEEFRTAIEICKIKDTDILLNILAGGIPLDKYFTTKPYLYRKYEINKLFSESDNMLLCQLNNIQEESDTIDTILVLASLHHINHLERQDFFEECFRILKPVTGKFIIGDVIEDSKEAKWLNEFVNKYNPQGHNGLFFSNKDKVSIETARFKTEIEIKSYPWIFNNEEELVDFCRNLFGLDLATDYEILEGIKQYLNVEKKEKYIINWTLIYFISRKN